jgi:two-component system sensor histidine kinase QseC
MNSIRIRLFAILLLATGVVWISAFVWIQQSTRAEVERVLDARLAESGQMVSSLISDRRIDVADAATLVEGKSRNTEELTAGYSNKLSCQIWSLDGVLVGQSGSAPTDSLAGQEAGFSDSLVDGERWRVYTIINEELGVRVMVGDSHQVRDRLVTDVTTGLVLPALLILPVLAGLIWVSVRSGLRPLDRLADGLSRRSADDLNPVDENAMPREIRPMGTALNGLFSRVNVQREREKAFTSFAAHELKTPLAGIKTQAQVAMLAPDEATRSAALVNMQHGIGRTDRMVRQLLSLASLDEAEKGPVQEVDVGLLIRDVVGDLTRIAATKQISITVAEHQPLSMKIDPTLLSVALRNVIENAIIAAPENSEIDILLEIAAEAIGISVLDRGAGIPEADRTRVINRFFRGSGAYGEGSGLGLAIVNTAIKRIGGQLRFAARAGGGEIVRLQLPLT